MIILAIDTSCEQASCALNIDGKVIEIKSPEDKRKHSSVLMPMVSKFLKENNVSVSEIDLFAVGSGPGSFTGIRIGMSAVKGIALAEKKPVITAKSLDILANKYNEKGFTVCPVIDARNRQVYTAIYRWNGQFYEPASDYTGIVVEKLAEILQKEKNPIMLCGDACEKYITYFQEAAGPANITADNKNRFPSAAVLSWMAADKIPLTESKDAASVLPFYLRKSQAERLYGNK